jgi:hypothetical protein
LFIHPYYTTYWKHNSENILFYKHCYSYYGLVSSIVSTSPLQQPPTCSSSRPHYNQLIHSLPKPKQHPKDINAPQLNLYYPSSTTNYPKQTYQSWQHSYCQIYQTCIANLLQPTIAPQPKKNYTQHIEKLHKNIHIEIQIINKTYPGSTCNKTRLILVLSRLLLNVPPIREIK